MLKEQKPLRVVIKGIPADLGREELGNEWFEVKSIAKTVTLEK